MALLIDREPNDRDRANKSQKLNYNSYSHMLIDELLDERNMLKRLDRDVSPIDEELSSRFYR